MPPARNGRPTWKRGGLSEQDRVVPVMNRAHFHDRAGLAVGRVVAEKFSERPLGQGFPRHRHEFTLEDDFRVRRDRQPGMRPRADFQRRLADRTGEVEFRVPGRKRFHSRDEKSRVVAVHDRNGTRLARVPVLVRDDRAVAAHVVELHRDPVAPVDLNPVDGCIDPAGIGIAHHDDAARTDVGAAILAVPDRRGKPCEIDVRARKAILQERAVLYRDGLLDLHSLALLHPRPQRVDRSERRVDAQR